MSSDDIVALLVAVILVGYLVVALLFPENM
ncbi:MAG: K(+)-transporting ATPase subunit F [Acidobacteria bacterium]|nr:K(+)-transporting ATPase subunit F [Acidobacteriota bacterium]